MALITCSECGNQTSSKAASCPTCGNPINVQPSKTVQQVRGNYTAKFIKLFSGLAMIAGVIGCIAGATPMALLLIFGFFGFVVGRFME